MNSNYSFDFIIPQGPTGPSSEGLKAYGGKYNNSEQTISLSIATPSQVPLANTMPNSNTTDTTANTIITSQSGIYEINYFINMSVAVATTVTVAVRNNNSNIPSTVISRALSVGTNSLYSGSTIVNLASGANIDLAISSSVATSITFGTGVNASLTIKRLN